MQLADQQLGRPGTPYTNTKANIEAITGLIGGEVAYASDTGEFGHYDAVALAWSWGGGGSATWGGITGTLSAQTDLQSALDAKVPTTTTVNGHALSANVTVTKSDVGLSNVDNTSDASKPVSTAQAAADAAVLASAESYADGLVVGLWDDRGNFDASGGAYPSSGGSGSGGAILKGDTWTISVAGTLPTGQVVEIGDVVRALVNTPGNTQANWAIQQNNIGYTAENSANKSNDGTMASDSATKYVTEHAAKTYADTVSSNASVIAKVLTGFSAAGTRVAIAATDSILDAFGKAQKWLNDLGALAFLNTVGTSQIDDGSVTTAKLASNDGWVAESSSWGYSSVDTPIGVVDVAADITSYIGVGDKIKFTQTTVKYFVVMKLSFSAGVTRVWLYGGTDYTLVNAAISSVYYSHAKVPVGFNALPSKWTYSATNTSNCSKATPTANTWYGGSGLSPTGISIDVPIGAWLPNISALVEIVTPATSGSYGVRTTLSTSSSSESDAGWTGQFVYPQGATSYTTRDTYTPPARVLAVTTKTTHYLDILTGQSSVTSISIRGDIATTTIDLVCAYL